MCSTWWRWRGTDYEKGRDVAQRDDTRRHIWGLEGLGRGVLPQPALLNVFTSTVRERVACVTLFAMNTALDPIVSEFSTQKEADAHDQWFRARVEAALRQADDPTTPRFSTDEVMRRMGAVIQAAEARHAHGSVA